MNKSHNTDVLFTFMLFCLYIVLCLMLIISTFNSYHVILDRVDQSYKTNTCLEYIANKVRHFDNDDSVYISTFDGLPALRMKECIDYKNYETIIYSDQGSIKELYVEEGVTLTRDAGIEIFTVSYFDICYYKDGFIKVECTDENNKHAEIIISTKSGQEVAK